MTKQEHGVHPAASVWPMLPEPDLRRLADDIAANGLRHPIVLDKDGQILDGRNRNAACQIAGVEPTFETYDGDDPVSYILSANNERRHLSLPQRAASTALTLAQAGRRKGGKWEYGVTAGTAPDGQDSDRSAWKNVLWQAGLILDHCPEKLPLVASGELALDAAVKEAQEIKAEKEKLVGLPPDLKALVEAGEITLNNALRRAKLPVDYQERVASGALTLAEAEHLSTVDAKEFKEAIERAVGVVQAILSLWPEVEKFKESPLRDDVLEALSSHDREQYLSFERETA